MRLVRWLNAPNITSGHGEPENPMRKWCSTNQRLSKPTRSASSHCSRVSLYNVFQSILVPSNGRCVSYKRPNCMVYLLTQHYPAVGRAPMSCWEVERAHDLSVDVTQDWAVASVATITQLAAARQGGRVQGVGWPAMLQAELGSHYILDLLEY